MIVDESGDDEIVDTLVSSLAIVFAGDDVVDAFVVTGGSGVSDPGGIRLLVPLRAEVVELVINTLGASAVDVI